MPVRIRPAFPNNPSFTSQAVSPQGGASNASGRIHGNSVYVEDDDYAVGRDDYYIGVATTDGTVHTIDFSDVEGRFDGQLVNVTVVAATGAGAFNVLLTSGTYNLATVGSTLWAKWDETTNTWVALALLPSGPASVVIPVVSDLGPTPIPAADVIVADVVANDVAFQLPQASTRQRWEIRVNGGANQVILHAAAGDDFGIAPNPFSIPALSPNVLVNQDGETTNQVIVTIAGGANVVFFT